jgi:hypothetical protein
MRESETEKERQSKKGSRREMARRKIFF